MSDEELGPSNGLYLDYGYGSHVGLRRELNEDSSVVTASLFAVADGMGGHDSGEVASSLAVQTLAEGWEAAAEPITRETIATAIDEADRRIRAATDSRAGTTLTGAALTSSENALQWLVFNIGDSRTYIHYEGALLQLTRDHSQVQEMFESGMITAEELHYHPQRNVITRALGAGDADEVDFSVATVHAGQRLLVCSDGLTGELTDAEIAKILGAGRSPQDTVDWLIHQALRSGGRDNVTLVVVDVKGA
ncbi:MAG TPA: protein phosphatase 2C domain-containing protein [Candidatus Nesterenkonia stercoripullorum]|jgi:serine/threonine protein phosphatase PrpC|uniref:Protein phosphatase 2C domain-containing protein n=1 Tax=Candidatus Nesterenkonia stercoripullorum TaxID=2838701 RepID=A0A9D2A885_9MICC|nr:protein phosphatase 2C domain-containing protein [Candidatus Nesterenkonia stercoripullorum]